MVLLQVIFLDRGDPNAGNIKKSVLREQND
jgi:hypothetical protein